MTALQWIIKEAKIIRKKSPKMEWKKAVAQASAIYASKHKGVSPVGKKKAAPKKKKVGVIKSKPYKGYQYTIDENETGDFVDKYFTLSEAKKDLKRLISKDKKSGKYKKDFYRITHINTGKTVYGVKASKEIKKVLAKKGLKMPHGYSTTKRVRKVSGVKKKKISEQSILNKIHKVKHDVERLDEAQHKHMMNGVGKLAIEKYQKVQNDIIALEKALNRNLEQMKQFQYKTPFWKQRFKISNTKLKSYIKELKTHAKELKKHI